jgi:nitrous oxidase accessory protein NosD
MRLRDLPVRGVGQPVLRENSRRDGRLGFTLYASSTNNKIHDNVLDCSVPFDFSSGCDGNWIYRNDVLRGLAKSEAYNRWANRDGEGNYWSDYRGEDKDGDGFGESPHRILGSTFETDHHPAIAPYHPEWVD